MHQIVHRNSEISASLDTPDTMSVDQRNAVNNHVIQLARKAPTPAVAGVHSARATTALRNALVAHPPSVTIGNLPTASSSCFVPSVATVTTIANSF